ncbi:single-stranded DNA-binding protein [Microbacterium sp. NRRL B-14842]|uniref:single-stranded DNA-binding protein n=1 Tax=Microbacterium sp. NRRL B-14842 TaxID=3162881 RepID=UPI003D28BD75
MTIVGRVATEPTPGRTSAGVPVTNFRLASTHRRFDAASGSWVDAGTNWFSIAAFRQLAEHARASLRVGDSVIVSGRLRVRPWESNGKQGTSGRHRRRHDRTRSAVGGPPRTDRAPVRLPRMRRRAGTSRRPMRKGATRGNSRR